MGEIPDLLQLTFIELLRRYRHVIVEKCIQVDLDISILHLTIGHLGVVSLLLVNEAMLEILAFLGVASGTFGSSRWL